MPDGVETVATVLRPRPAEDVRGRTVAYFCTAPASAHTRRSPRTSPPSTAPTSSTSRGTSPTATPLRAELARLEADVFLVELKAAAVDVVAELALARGADIVLAANDVVVG